MTDPKLLRSILNLLSVPTEEREKLLFYELCILRVRLFFKGHSLSFVNILIKLFILYLSKILFCFKVEKDLEKPSVSLKFKDTVRLVQVN